MFVQAPEQSCTHVTLFALSRNNGLSRVAALTSAGARLFFALVAGAKDAAMMDFTLTRALAHAAQMHARERPLPPETIACLALLAALLRLSHSVLQCQQFSLQ